MRPASGTAVAKFAQYLTSIASFVISRSLGKHFAASRRSSSSNSWAEDVYLGGRKLAIFFFGFFRYFLNKHTHLFLGDCQSCESQVSPPLSSLSPSRLVPMSLRACEPRTVVSMDVDEVHEREGPPTAPIVPPSSSSSSSIWLVSDDLHMSLLFATLPRSAAVQCVDAWLRGRARRVLAPPPLPRAVSTSGETRAR